MTLKQDVMNLIAEQIDEMFGAFFEGKCLVITFSGEIVSIDDDMVAALQKLQGKKYGDAETIFIHQVKGNRH